MTDLVGVGDVREWWTATPSRWRSGWATLSAPLRVFWLLVVGWALVGTIVIALQIGGSDFLFEFSTWTYAVVPAGSGLVLVLTAVKGRHPATAPWAFIGVGVLCWGLGELIWVYYSGLLGVEVPYPGWADVLYVAAYPFVLTGLLMLPHVHPRRWERVRLLLDALAGAVALSAIMWTFYLKDAIYLDPGVGLLENTVNLFYPAGDLMLLIGLLVLATRRSQYQFDGRLLMLALATFLTAVADIAYVFQVEDGIYVDGGRLDALWLLAYGLFAATAVLIAARPRLREQADRPERVWPMIAPYTAVAVLFALTLGELGRQATVLQTATAAVGLLIIARQAVAIRETRDVVENQRDSLVASISHELRTPLTAMSGFTDILEEDPDMDPVERSELISIVNGQTKHLTRIVGDLVDVARDKLDTTTLTYASIDVADLVESALGMLTGEASSSDVTTEIPPGLTVTGDADRLRQVLVNYLTNAARYGNGGVQVHARTIGRGGTMIEVHDDGPGVPKKHEITIWDRFERGAHTYLSTVQGSGLGLAIARQLVRAHGGQTGHRPSEHLGGACFWLTIPSPTTGNERTTPITRAVPVR